MKLAIVLGGLAVLAVVALVAFDPSYQQQRADQAFYRSQVNQLDIERRQLELDERRAVSSVAISADVLVRIAIPVVGLVVFAVLVDVYYHRRRPLVRPDSRGLLPVGRDELVSSSVLAGELVRLHHEIEALRAVYQVPVPLHYTYAPRFASPGAAGELVGASGDVSAPVPSFADLLAAGRVGRGAPLLLGYTAGAALAGNWRDLYSSAVGGVQGSGKTTTLRFLACQSVLHGARFVLLDPHAETGEESLAATLGPLSSAFVCEPAISDQELLSSVQLVRGELDRRLAGGSDRWPLICAVDEFSRLMARSSAAPELAQLLESIAQEGRKVGVFALLSGQVWLASRSGGTELRYSLASCYVHRMHRRMASLLLPEGEGSKVERLASGSALLWRTSGEVVQVEIPNTTAADVVAVGELLGKPDGSQMVAKSNQATTALGSGNRPSSDAKRAATAFLAGSSPSDLVLELRGVKSSEGRRYQSALDEVLVLVREGLRS